MRDEFMEWVSTYPREFDGTEETFGKTSAPFQAVTRLVPAAIRTELTNNGRYTTKGSAGQSGWARVSWAAIFDQSVTTSAQKGFYVVYLLSQGGERLYLSVNQGCTQVEQEMGRDAAFDILRQRAIVLRRRGQALARRLNSDAINLNTVKNHKLGPLYEAGQAFGVEYDTRALPADDVLRADLKEAMRIYHHLSKDGGWEADDTLEDEADADGIKGGMGYKKSYTMHRRAERVSKHSRAAKKAHGDRCMGCDKRMAEVYGVEADGLIEAHHLVPLFTLADGESYTFDPKTDFAVLCPNCHRMIHRLLDPSDMKALRALARSPEDKEE